MIRVHNARTMRLAALAAAVLALCFSASWGYGQKRENPQRQAPRYAAPQNRGQNRQQYKREPQYRSAPQPQYRQGPQARGGMQGNPAQRPQSGYPAQGAGSAYQRGANGSANGGANGNQGLNNGQRPAYGGASAAPQGHLEDWLNQHRNVPVQDQERMLQSDPGFRRLPSADQQRLTQQLQQVNKMPQQQRDHPINARRC